MLGLGYLIKLVVFERESYFWLKCTVMLTFNFTFRTAKNLCPSLQKPPLPSKIPGYALADSCEYTDIDIETGIILGMILRPLAAQVNLEKL